jgi:hypothetical protein
VVVVRLFGDRPIAFDGRIGNVPVLGKNFFVAAHTLIFGEKQAWQP